jgi:hypothetical protein
MDLQPLPSRQLVAYADDGGFADNTVKILARLGYEILSPERFEKRKSRDPDHEPDLLIVDEERLCDVVGARVSGSVPIVVLTQSEISEDLDPRVAAAVRPPVGMHDLFRVVQQVLEDRPRTSLRARTELPAVARRSGHEWDSTLVSLSENGCLLRSPEAVPLGTTLQLAFEIPGTGTAHVHAETAYQLLPDLGLVFSSISPQIRQAIAGFVTASLLGAYDKAAPTPSR